MAARQPLDHERLPTGAALVQGVPALHLCDAQRDGQHCARPSLQLLWISADSQGASQWTHLVGSAIAVFTAAYLLLDLSPVGSLTHGRKGWLAPFAGIPYPFPNDAQPSVTVWDTIGFAAFLLSASVCLGASRVSSRLIGSNDQASATGFSAFFHTFVAHSKEASLETPLLGLHP